MIEAIILCALFGTFILLAFIKGVELGAKLNRNERSFSDNDQCNEA